jgi:hypothetical protein
MQPLAVQVSARVGLHAWQAVPAPPPPTQLERLSVSQVAPLQQPFAQFAALQVTHTPASQAALKLPPVKQLLHAPPPVPHAKAAVPGLHVFPAPQQPFGQEVALQTHTPPWHICPATH